MISVPEYAMLPENKSGFWIQKQYGETGRCTYLVFHEGMSEFRDSISDAKQRLRDRVHRIQANKKAMGFTPMRKVVTDSVWTAYGSPQIFR
jgi:hypothetical protein